MSQYFTISSYNNHVAIDFADRLEKQLAELSHLAEREGCGKATAFAPEVDYLRTVIDDLRIALPPHIQRAGWPSKYLEGSELDQFILDLLKDPARLARGRGTNASAKKAIGF